MMFDMIVKKEEMLDWDGWNQDAQSYLTGLDDDIDLDERIVGSRLASTLLDPREQRHQIEGNFQTKFPYPKISTLSSPELVSVDFVPILLFLPYSRYMM